MDLNSRIDRLEQAVNPPVELPWITVFSDETGRRWIATEGSDYRAALGGVDSEDITEEQYQELTTKFQIIRVIFKDMRMEGGKWCNS